MSEEKLPEGWAEASLGDLIDGFQSGRSLSGEGRPAGIREIGVLKISAVTWGEFDPSENKTLPAGTVPRDYERIRRGDLLISRANTAELVGAVVRVKDDHPNLMLPDKLLRIVLQTNIDPDFVKFALRTPAARAHLEDNATGTSQSMRNLSQPKMAATPLWLPPLAEQRRIVEKVEALLAQANAARARLAKLPTILKRFRQSILSAACSGRLTEAWKQGRKLESIEEVLRRVRFDQSHTGRAATEDSIVGQVLAVGDPQLPAPDGWKWVSLTEVARLESGHTPSRKHPEYWDGDIAWIGILDAGEHHGGRISKTRQTITPKGIENSAARLLPKNTVCLSRTASVGYVVIMDREMATSQDFVDWVCSEAIVPEFLMYALMAEGEGIKKFGRGTTHTTIYFPEVKALHICLPPVEEQKQIVRLAAHGLQLADAIEARVAAATARADKITQAILAKAFRGELVPTEAELARKEARDYEPATALLARIRAQRAASEATPKPATRTPRRRATAVGKRKW
jgi:type I restriction enzyme S subunit